MLAFKGTPSKKILNFLLKSSFLKKPPKSLDRNFLKTKFNYILNEKISLYDMVSTLSHFTVDCINLSLNFLPSYPKSIIISGGGYKNNYIMNLLRKKNKSKFYGKNEINIDTNFIESELIAFLSARSFYNLPITFKSTTGTKLNVSGGKIFYYKKP